MFGRTVDFQGVSFGGTADFTSCDMKAGALFSTNEDDATPGATFWGAANFTSVHFGDYAGFYGAVFNGEAILNSAKFDNYASFSDFSSTPEKDRKRPWRFSHATMFLDKVDFTCVSIALEAQFSGSVFWKKVSFNEAKIGSNAVFLAVPERSFAGAVFLGEADFSEAQIEGNAFFADAVFMKNANFSEARIGSDADFAADPNKGIRGAVFEADADFSGTHLKGSARFQGAWFSNGADFTDSEITGQSYFQGAKFLDEAKFYATKFDSNAFFGSIIDGNFLTGFLGSVSFGGAHFADLVDFSSCLFKNEVYFDLVRINGRAVFSTTFEGPFFFREAAVHGTADFTGAVFMKTASFDESHFDASAYFGSAAFSNMASFRDTAFHTVYFSTTGRAGDQARRLYGLVVSLGLLVFA